jgi:GntR family transcriptional regulator
VSNGGERSLEERIIAVARTSVDAGSSLPGEPALSRLLGVSRPALREALARLEHDGLILRRRGAGTIVNPAAFEIEVRFDQQAELADVLAGAGYAPLLEVLARSIVPMGADDAAALHVAKGEPALRTVKRWRADGRAAMVAVDVVALPSDRVDAVRTADHEIGLFELVRDVLGESVDWELAWPGALAASTVLSSWLEVPARSALMSLDLIGISRAGRRVYHAREYSVPGIVRSGFVRTVRS